MKNITIGCVGQHWELAKNARYYAERGDGEEYAFGATPSEALARLEAREAIIASDFDQDLAEEVAFLALGAAEFLSDHRDANLDEHDGYMGLIGKVICHAPMLAEYWKLRGDEGFGGVWLYDVTKRFGWEWAEGICSQSDESPSERLEYIIEDEVEKWR